jgi:hypothetical protein
LYNEKESLKQEKRITLILDPELSRAFSIEKLVTTLQLMDSTLNSSRILGRTRKNGLFDILSTLKQPIIFKRAKVISILKPGKYGPKPACYRPFPLLSVIYKLLEGMILQKIQLMIEKPSPVSQAGFRKHKSCTEQVMALTTHIEAGF